ncbi:MAG: aminoglycoside phosphotransferase family protein [Clostridia bacterium]|nr:aminoglycoside phosphotransferase family protein [Clostridia bacterium]
MDKTENEIIKICARFGIAGTYQSYEVINSGHINMTYKVYFKRNGEIKDYILQRVNTYVFKNPEDVMENISSVTEYIRAKIKATGVTAKRNVLHYSKTEEGNYYTWIDGEFWRCCRYIDDSVSFTNTDDLKIIEESGKAFGKFQTYLADYPVKNLHIVIPHFHNTIMRYEALREAIAKNAAGRVDTVRDVIEGYEELEELATRPYRLQRDGVLPLRVTHNDTKTSNILFDADTSDYLAVIDLDTVMPGLVAFDFGDAIRVAGSTVDEDEQDLSKVALDLERYEAFTRGFVESLGGMLTEAEMDTLALGAVAMTAECGVRFLTDYLNGDKYFRIHYPEQNLARARCHLTLSRDMVKKLDQMQAIVDKYAKNK